MPPSLVQKVVPVLRSACCIMRIACETDSRHLHARCCSIDRCLYHQLLFVVSCLYVICRAHGWYVAGEPLEEDTPPSTCAMCLLMYIQLCKTTFRGSSRLCMVLIIDPRLPHVYVGSPGMCGLHMHDLCLLAGYNRLLHHNWLRCYIDKDQKHGCSRMCL